MVVQEQEDRIPNRLSFGAHSVGRGRCIGLLFLTVIRDMEFKNFYSFAARQVSS